MNKAVFFDRDGVINNNSDHYYVFRKEDFVLNNGLVSVLKEVARLGYLIIIISNQSGIAKNLYNKNDVERLHQYFKEEMQQYGITVTDFYYCPHHPEYSKCLCRKPDSVLIEKAIARYNIKVDGSFFVGDSERDIEAAKKCGLKSILVKSNLDLSQQIDFNMFY